MKRNYWITIASLFLLRGIDLYLTWLYTPTLSNEYNPLVSLMGSSWLGLITVQVLFLTVVSAFGAYYFFKPPRIVSTKGLSFPDFIYCYFFHTLKPWPQRFFSKIRDKRAHMLFNGFMFLVVALFISLFAIVNNALLILEVEWYTEFLTTQYTLYFPLVFIVIALSSALLFFVLQYRKYTQYSEKRRVTQ